jgi:hypothetical protein
VSSMRTCNLKNVLGLICPGSLRCFYSECGAFGRRQKKFRESIRSSGIEFRVEQARTGIDYASPFCERWGKAAVVFEHASAAELSPTGKEMAVSAPAMKKGRAN